MKFLVALSCFLAIAAAKPGAVLHHPLAYGYAAAPVGGFSYSTHTVAHAAPAVAYHAAAPAVAYHAAAAPAVAYHHAPAVAAAYAAPAVATAPVVAAAPAVAAYAAAPVVAPVAAPVKSQYHAQDELGQASYGHAEPYQAHHAHQDAAGNKAGSYSYVAPNGQVFHTNYVADALGYRVASNALPVGPSHGPAVPADTPEVVAARAAHFAAHVEARSRTRRDVAVVAPAAYHAYTPYHHYAAPLAYSTPLVRAAAYTTVVNNPGHAYSYHVY